VAEGRVLYRRRQSLAFRAVAEDAAVDTIRREWEAGHRRLEELSDDEALYHRLLAQVEVVLDELRRRVGETYTLADLAGAYGEADRWSREALEDRGPARSYRDAALVGDAAFYIFARGASDYRP
jgi:hypothetical protein